MCSARCRKFVASEFPSDMGCRIQVQPWMMPPLVNSSYCWEPASWMVLEFTVSVCNLWQDLISRIRWSRNIKYLAMPWALIWLIGVNFWEYFELREPHLRRPYSKGVDFSLNRSSGVTAVFISSGLASRFAQRHSTQDKPYLPRPFSIVLSGVTLLRKLSLRKYQAAVCELSFRCRNPGALNPSFPIISNLI